MSHVGVEKTSCISLPVSRPDNILVRNKTEFSARLVAVLVFCIFTLWSELLVGPGLVCFLIHPHLVDVDEKTVRLLLRVNDPTFGPLPLQKLLEFTPLLLKV